MALKTGLFPEDSHYKTDLYSKMTGEQQKKKFKKISHQQETTKFFNSIKGAN